MGKWLWLALFGCGVANADMLDALQAYEKQQFAEAKRQFEQLLPLGNELATFNLGAMAYQGEGQSPDLVKAIAHFMLAAELNHLKAQEILNNLVSRATTQQLELATLQFNELKSRVVIIPTDLENQSRNADAPMLIKRVAPNYPKNAARDNIFGYVVLRFLVDERGEVAAVDTLDAFPQNTFEKSAIHAIKKWRYAESAKKHLLSVRLDYSLEGNIKISKVEKSIADNKIWENAVLGAPHYQFAIGMLLSLLEIQSGNSFWFDPELPLSRSPDFTIYEKRAPLRPGFDGFWGSAIVKVTSDGTITEQIKADFAAQSKLTSLIGQKLIGNVEADVYRISRYPDIGGKRVIIKPSLRVTRSMSSKFWWEQAAKNGSLEAQRVLAAFQPQWEAYLLAQKDAQVMAWTGTRLILEGQREQGMLLLEQAIAKNYQPAKEMKQQFM